jgi:hypothetical protein
MIEFMHPVCEGGFGWSLIGKQLRLYGVFLLITGTSGLACQVNCRGNVGGPSEAEMARSGPENWSVEGRSWKVTSTYYLALPEGLQFTIEVPVADVPATMADAERMAWPVMRHAYEKRIYARTHLSKLGGGSAAPERIGVSLFRSDGIHTKGMRVALSFAEIRDRIEREQRR